MRRTVASPACDHRQDLDAHAREWMPVTRIGLLPVVLSCCAVVVAPGCGGAEADPARDAAPERTLLVDEARGTFSGLVLGDSPARVRAAGGPRRCVEGVPTVPAGEDPNEAGGRFVSGYRPRRPDGPYRQCVMRNRHVALTVFVGDGVRSLTTTDARARTRGGVGVGDSAGLVAQRYPGARCEAFEDTDDADSVAAGCVVPVARPDRGVRLSFGLDRSGQRVTSIQVDVTSWRAMKRLRQR
jgi:hypothetical protein